MKKIMAALTILMCFASTSAFAQLKEVRGVQTRMVEYRNDKGKERHGIEFKNENNYAVWVEADLNTGGFTYRGYPNFTEYSISEGTKDKKSFTLNAQETYVWQCGDKMIWDGDDYYDRYFVNYKAYKAE